MEKKHSVLRDSLTIRCIVFSHQKDFSKIYAISDAWIPSRRLWVGEYPYLLRPAFEELCDLRIRRHRK